MICKKCDNEIKKAGCNGYYHKDKLAFYDCTNPEPKEQDSLLSAIEQGDKEKIKDIEQRAKKGETIRLI